MTLRLFSQAQVTHWFNNARKRLLVCSSVVRLRGRPPSPQIAQGSKNKLKERYSEKIEVLESLVIALRRKLQTAIENGDVEEKSASSSIDAESAKPNAARGGNGDVVVMAQLQEKVQQLTAALQARTKECKAQGLLLEQKEAKTIELQNAIVQAQNKSPEASGLSRKVQILNSELEEARNAGKK